MNHLTVEEIIDFVSLSEMTEEAVELSATVNGHIRKCDKCLALVRAFQMVHDEFSSLNTSEDVKKYISKLESTTNDQNDIGH